MKEIAPTIDFNDATYKSCEMTHENLIVYLESWDEKTLKITFYNVIEFIYKTGSFVSGAYEINDESLLTESLSLYYEKPPEKHPFKVFGIKDIDDFLFFKIVAEKALVLKE